MDVPPKKHSIGTPPPTNRSSYMNPTELFGNTKSQRFLEYLSKICFAENLVVSRCAHRLDRFGRKPEDAPLIDLNQLEEVGRTIIDVEKINENQFKINSFAQFEFHENRLEHFSAESIVNNKLELITENRHEKSIFGGVRSSKKWVRKMTCKSIDINANKFAVSFQNSNDIGNEYYEEKIHKIMDEQTIVFKGIGMLYKRMWVVAGFVGTIECISLNITGVPCRVLFACGHRRSIILHGERHQIVRIRESTYYESGVINVIKSIYLVTGHLLREKFQWYGNAYVIHFNPLLNMPPDNMDRVPKTFDRFLSMADDHDDITCFSIIELDESLKCLVQYYVLNLISEKPDDILEFTVEYFMKLASIGRNI